MGPTDLAKNFRICLSQLLMNIPPGSSSKPVGAHYFIQAGGGAGLDKIKTFRDRSLNFSKLSVKVRKLRQQNLRQKVRNL